MEERDSCSSGMKEEKKQIGKKKGIKKYSKQQLNYLMVKIIRKETITEESSKMIIKEEYKLLLEKLILKFEMYLKYKKAQSKEAEVINTDLINYLIMLAMSCSFGDNFDININEFVTVLNNSMSKILNIQDCLEADDVDKNYEEYMFLKRSKNSDLDDGQNQGVLFRSNLSFHILRNSSLLLNALNNASILDEAFLQNEVRCPDQSQKEDIKQSLEDLRSDRNIKKEKAIEMLKICRSTTFCFRELSGDIPKSVKHQQDAGFQHKNYNPSQMKRIIEIINPKKVASKTIKIGSLMSKRDMYYCPDKKEYVKQYYQKLNCEEINATEKRKSMETKLKEKKRLQNFKTVDRSNKIYEKLSTKIQKLKEIDNRDSNWRAPGPSRVKNERNDGAGTSGGPPSVLSNNNEQREENQLQLSATVNPNQEKSTTKGRESLENSVRQFTKDMMKKT